MGDIRISEQDVVFAEATPEQRRLSWQLNSASWAQPMTPEQYVERESDLSRTELTRNGACKYWVLHMRGDPLEIVASCESIRKAVFVRRPATAATSTNGVTAATAAATAAATTNGNGTHAAVAPSVEEAHAYGIASVYTNPKYRRRGMANLMLHRLQDFMDNEGAVCSALYSDIGKAYYSALGWTVFPHNEATLHLLKPGRRIAPNSCCDVKTKYLQRSEIRALCDLDVADLKGRLQRKPDDGKTTRVAFVPSWAQLEWQLVREEDNHSALFPADDDDGSHQPKPKLERRGAITEDGRSWITWEHDFKRKQLRVMRIVTTRPDSEARRVDHIWALLGAAVAEASNWAGFKSVSVWNPDQTTTSGIKATSNAYQNDVKVVFTVRDGAIPSLRWIGGGDTKKTVWEDNYRYAWC